jgi:hypothetical protein
MSTSNIPYFIQYGNPPPFLQYAIYANIGASPSSFLQQRYISPGIDTLVMERSTAHTLTRSFAVLLWISALLLGIGGLTLLFAGRPSMLMSAFGPASPEAATGYAFAGTTAVVVGVIMLVFAILYATIGTGLWNMRPWARIAALVISIISLLGFPLGTLIGIVGIWMFGFDRKVRSMFHDPTHTRAYGVAGRRAR